MRKVSIEAAHAFINKQYFVSSNTGVDLIKGEAYLYLHGNLIAKTKKGKIWISAGGYKPSNTTRDRLNALPGVNLRILKGEFIFNHNKWNGEWMKIN